ncbi:MAG: NirD/YgiW/YdeI family stress tolerance protein, partial [Alphaproteobacteria bacterium]|nr:NirD/YgiW/YdeI family stress tolerance protein [Alphaproteobacteria bacterium]
PPFPKMAYAAADSVVEKYLFEDATGSITVEIDDDEWRGQTVTPADTVKLYGEVDRGIFKTEIEIDRVEKI